METNDIMKFRIRSKRTRKRKQKEDLEKQLLSLHREERQLGMDMQCVGWTELDPPIQRGFIRFFVLRKDVKLGKQAAIFESILRKINTMQFSSRKDFKKKGKRFGKKTYNVRQHELRDVEEREFYSSKFSNLERIHFYETLTHAWQCKKPIKVFRFNEPSVFVLRIQPNLITKVRIKNLDLEERLGEIQRYLSFNGRREKQDKLLYGSCGQWRLPPKLKYQSPLANKSLSRVLNEFDNDKPHPLNMRPSIFEGLFFCEDHSRCVWCLLNWISL